MDAIRFESVTKIYRVGFLARRVTGVNDLSFSVRPNSITGFVGPNGAGKTTTIKLLLGLIRPDSGRIMINGKPAPEPSSRANVAYLSEQPHFYEHLTARESLELACRMLGQRLPVRSEIERVLGEVELADTGAKKVKNLSKGMQQRLGMAMALLGNASTFVLDEPMSGLDPLGRRLFRSLLKKLGDQGKCVLFSTHSLEDISMLCTDILVLSRGQLVYQGAVSALLSRGYEGTEIVAAHCTEEHQRQLATLGYQTNDSGQDCTTIFVPDGKDAHECLQWLFRSGIEIKSISPRNKSLEAILYSSDGSSGQL